MLWVKNFALIFPNEQDRIVLIRSENGVATTTEVFGGSGKKSELITTRIESGSF